MATVTLTFPDGWLPRIKDAYSSIFNYQDEILNPAYDPNLPVDPITNPYFIPNPESQNDFVKRMVGVQIKAIVKQYEGHIAQQQALQGKQTEIDTDLIIT